MRKSFLGYSTLKFWPLSHCFRSLFSWKPVCEKSIFRKTKLWRSSSLARWCSGTVDILSFYGYDLFDAWWVGTGKNFSPAVNGAVFMETIHIKTLTPQEQQLLWTAVRNIVRAEICVEGTLLLVLNCHPLRWTLGRQHRAFSKIGKWFAKLLRKISQWLVGMSYLLLWWLCLLSSTWAGLWIEFSTKSWKS